MFLDRLSPSKVKVYDDCKAKYKFRYIDRLPEEFNKVKNTDALQFGTFIHKVFEDGYKLETYEELNELAKSLRPQYTFDKARERKIEACLRNFVKFNNQLTETVSTEMMFSVEMLGDVKLNGIIDRVVKGETGKYLVIDYKTSRRAISRRELYTDTQMMMYVAAIHTMYNVPVESITAAHYYPHLDELVSIKYNKSQINIFLQKIKDKVWEIRKKKATDFPAQRNQFCNWCGFKDLCPLHGGTPEMLAEAKEKYSKKKKKT
jgi:putative RecB family exonuclease